MPSGLFSLRPTFELSKSESLRDVSVTRIGDTFPTVFRRLLRWDGCQMIQLFSAYIVGPTMFVNLTPALVV